MPDQILSLADIAGLIRAGALEDAHTGLQNRIKTGQGDHDTWQMLAAVLQAQGRWRKAIKACDAAYRLSPDKPDALQAKAEICLAHEAYPEALACFEKLISHPALERLEERASIWMHYGICLGKTGHAQRAITAFEKACQIDPADWRPPFNLANACHRSGALDDAVDNYKKALSLAPGQPAILYNLGSCLSDMARPEDAIAAFRQIPEADRSPECLVNLALCQMQTGALKTGLHTWNARFALPGRHKKHQHIAELETSGLASLGGKTVLLWSEQGFGDCLQFLRFAERLKAMGARILLDCRDALAPLLQQQSHLIDKIYQNGDHADFQYPLMSLPLLLSQDDKDIGPSDGYIKYDQKPKTGGFVTGWLWQGYKGHQNDHNRSIPVHEIRQLMQSVSTEKWSFQMGEETAVHDLLDAGIINKEMGSTIRDFSDTAAFLAQIDCLVTVDTAVLHLAGAMGISTIALLHHNADWRWGLHGETSPWYHSLHLLRLKPGASWDSLAEPLNRLIGNIKA